MSERSETNVGLTDLLARVAWSMKIRYGVDMIDIEPAATPGYWIDREPHTHAGHPLHGCLGCRGPFRATYTYFDPPLEKGRFASPTRTWAALRANYCSAAKNDIATPPNPAPKPRNKAE